MFVYLSKKIAIPNNVCLNCISWNQKQGYIAIGGNGGLLKVIRADQSSAISDKINNSIKTRSTISTNNLTMNQTLEGHNGNIQVVTWNDEYQKLTSSDDNGVIIVWMLYKGSWYEEMINNRNKSIVKGMTWCSNGKKICIVYEDGAVIVGSVDGNRIWSKELKSLSLTAVQWSPDAKLLLFGLKNGQAHLYDDQGVFLTKLENISDDLHAIVALNWYDGRNGYTAIDCPTLAVCFQNGKVCLLKDTCDNNLKKIDTNMSITCCVWNTFGSLLAIAGVSIKQEKKDFNIICFYSAFGEHIKTLKVPGKRISSCTWESESLRICLTVDSNIFFANICPNYKWAYFDNTMIFSDEKINKNGVCITFWNTITNSCYFKYVRSLINIVAYGEHCVLATSNDPTHAKEGFILLVCNSISTPIDKKFLDLEPSQITMNNNTVIVASKNNFLLWNFRAPQNFDFNEIKSKNERIYHIDDTPTGITEVIQDLDRHKYFESSISRRNSTDPISCISTTENILLIARESGIIQQYSLPQVTLMKRYTSLSRPYKLAINCNSTTAAIIHNCGVLRLLQLITPKNYNQDTEIKISMKNIDEYTKFERKDTWAICWAEDNPHLLAIFEKSRIYVFRGLEPEEPIVCRGYMCYFRDLEIRCVLLDELIRRPEKARSELLLDVEVKSLRDTRKLLACVGLHEAEAFVCDNPHPRLWRLLGEHALRLLDLEAAENAMVRCTDYLSIRFVKKLRGIHDSGLQRAEVLAFLGDYDEAEKLYLELDRRDLAVTLRQKLAEYPRAIQLMQLGVASSDAQLECMYASWGEQLALRQEWRTACEHLERGRAFKQLLDCRYRLEEYNQLAVTADQLTEQTPELWRAARMLASVGMCQQAVDCFIRCADVRQAIETCIRSNRWDKALELARTWQLPGIDELLAKYAHHLLVSGHYLQAIELYRKANCLLEAAQLLLQLATKQAHAGGTPLRLKKIYVLAALLIQERIEGQIVYDADSTETRVVAEAWRGAEAYHFLLLAHRQLYKAEPLAALRTTLRLREYEDLIDQEQLYALLALTSCACGALSTCSRALIKLEVLKPCYEELSLELFGRRSPRDARRPSRIECRRCESLVPDCCIMCPSCSNSFPPCVVSGRALMNLTETWLCTVCRRYVSNGRDVLNVNGCPLCHSNIRFL
ncbi:PREDICTED: WD repeat-containing protein 35 [Ceratosolen solmsi marchali]|uniref:WD repeat-containing protein 35 n=1 Tax=Ceratosolen solmsi marchali TaxID=326594 RepID=A0AAJ6YT04_9HYME|nr:PREDICTED: WD repeat-containing protein 35 [Ceratosolen solmsi marchali]